MKKIILSVVILFIVSVVGLASVSGVSFRHLYESVQLGTHLGAKLACSTRYVSGFDEAQVGADIASYSPILNQLSIDFDPPRASVSLFGMAEASATYREGIGCTLDHGDETALDTLLPPAMVVSTAPWPAGNRVDTINPEIQAKLDAMLAEDNLADLNTRALLVVRGEKIIAESYAPGIEEQTPLLGWSMAKSVTAMLLGRLEYEGKVPPAPLFGWQDEKADLTLDQLLTMTSGMEWNEEYGPGSHSTRMLFLEPFAAGYAAGQPLAYVPGAHFAYSSGTANLLAKLVFDAAGGTPEANLAYFHESLAKPLGMTTAVFEPDSSGVFIGSSYLYASARDWARLGTLMLNRGEINGQRLLSAEWVDRATAPNTSENDPRYGYQFWLNGGGSELRWKQLPKSAYAMNGNRSQTVMVLPEQNIVLVRLGWTAGRYPLQRNFSEILSWF